MGLLDLCEKYYNTSNLYEVLQIGEKANEKEVKKAYHKLSLKVHPDRVPEDQKLEATEKFKVLGSIHSILTDKEKRAAYDLTKCVDDDESYISDDKNWNAYWTLVFKKITDEDIQAYEKKYMGSEEEKTDLKRAYLSGKGDMDYIVDHVPFARSENEETHRGILNEMIKNGEIPAYKAFTNESPDKRQKRLAKEKREAEELQKELDLCSRELMITLKKEDQQMDSANDQPAAKSKNGGKKSRGTRRKATAKSADKSSKRRK